MRKLAVLLALAGAACGSGRGSGSSSPVSGTVGGTGFTPAEIVAALMDPAPCPVTSLGTVEVGALGIRFATFTGTCGDLTHSTCVSHRSSRSVTLVVARAATGTASANVGPGTYAVADTRQFTIGTSGALELALGDSTTTDAQCADTTSAATGSLRIDQVSASQVTGHVDVNFADGGKLQGDFIASRCPFVPATCAVVAAGAICSGLSCS